MKNNTTGRLLAAAGALIWAAAHAAAVTDTYHFVASGFGPGAPQDPVSGSVTLTFDPTVPTSGVAVDSISLDIFGRDYTTQNTAFGFNGLDLFVDGTLNGTAVLPGTNDFFLEGAVNAEGQFTSGTSFIYSTAGGGSVFAARDVSVATPVPEPSTLWLFAVGLTLLGGLRLGTRGALPEHR